jgi:hypothetical protein
MNTYIEDPVRQSLHEKQFFEQRPTFRTMDHLAIEEGLHTGPHFIHTTVRNRGNLVGRTDTLGKVLLYLGQGLLGWIEFRQGGGFARVQLIHLSEKGGVLTKRLGRHGDIRGGRLYRVKEELRQGHNAWTAVDCLVLRRRPVVGPCSVD